MFALVTHSNFTALDHLELIIFSSILFIGFIVILGVQVSIGFC